eukprot:9952478-Lingulodinium_polyedra.AAC.1
MMRLSRPAVRRFLVNARPRVPCARQLSGVRAERASVRFASRRVGARSIDRIIAQRFANVAQSCGRIERALAR